MSVENKIRDLLGRLRRAAEPDIRDIVTEYVALTPDLQRLLSIIQAKRKAGAYLLGETLAILITHTGSRELYEETKEQLLKDDWALLKLYKAKYPDPDIETTLLSQLDKFASDNGNILRRAIIEAMAEVGSKAIVPHLELILFDLEPGARVNRAFAESMDIMAQLESKSESAFVAKLKAAIIQINQRPEDVSEIQSVLAPEPQAEEQTSLEPYYHDYRRAEKLIETDPDLAVGLLRKSAEALAKDIYRKLDLEKGGRTAKKMLLQDFVGAFNQNNVTLPAIMKILLQVFQNLGNFGAHDQEDESAHLTPKVASAAYQMFGELLARHKAWSDEISSDSTSRK